MPGTRAAKSFAISPASVTFGDGQIMTTRRIIGVALLIAGILVIAFQFFTSAKTSSSEVNPSDSSIIVLTTSFEVGVPHLIVGSGLAGLGAFLFLREGKKSQTTT